MASKGMLRGRGGSLGAYGVKNGVLGIPWGHRVDLMSLLMIHKACMQGCTSCGLTG